MMLARNNKMMNRMKSYDDNAKQTALMEREGLSAASLRRLSWRRHLAAAKMFGRTFSLDHQDREQRKQKQKREEHKTVLAKWIESSAEVRLLVDGNCKWSRLDSKRGKYGESLIHILLIIQQRQQQKCRQQECLILIVLLSHLFPLLLADVFESAKFKGLNCLHLAIAYGNEQLLNYLLEFDTISGAGKLVDGRVTGSLFRAPSIFANSNSGRTSTTSESVSWRKSFCVYFLAKNRKISDESSLGHLDRMSYWCDQMMHWPTANGNAHLLLTTDDRSSTQSHRRQANPSADGGGGDGGCDGNNRCTVYLGDSPLAWSVSLGKRTMFESLSARGGANLQACDANGHSCLHMLVINNQTGWSRSLIKHGLDPSIENHQGQTAYLMACRYGRAELFDEFLELTAVEFWSYSMIRCSGYPLNQLDSIQDDEAETCRLSESSSSSAVCVILESEQSSNEQKSQLLSSAVVKKLLEEKWRLFARRLFYNDLLLTLLHLFLLSVSIALRPAAADMRQQQLVANSGFAPTIFSRIDRTRLVGI